MSYNWSDMAILVRTRAQSGPIERQLAYCKIPYKMVGGMSFFDQREVKDILSLLSWITNPLSLMDVSRFAKNMVEGVGEKAFDVLYRDQDEENVTHEDLLVALTSGKKKMSTKLFNMKNLIDTAIHVRDNHLGSAYDALRYLDSELDITSTLMAQDNKDTERKSDSSRQDSFSTLVTMAKRSTTVDDFLDEAALNNNTDEEDENQVTISTIHAAKGKEWKVVLVPSISDTSLPHVMGHGSEEDVEQEFNAYYVAKTRAEECLILTRSMTDSRYGGPALPTKRSRFIEKNLKTLEKVGTTRLL